MLKLKIEPGIEAQSLGKELSLEVVGNNLCQVNSVSSIEDLTSGAISFYAGKSLSALEEILSKANTNAYVLIVSKELTEIKIDKQCALIISENPFHDFLKILPKFLAEEIRDLGISKNANVHESAKIGENISIDAFSVISRDVKIGKNVTIHPHVTIYPRVVIEDNVTIHSGASIREDVVLRSGVIIQNGAVIGADGFGYVPDKARGLVPVPQVGTVVLSSLVEVGANSCIDRATLGETKIGLGTKIDNLVQIGHNVQIGSHSIVCGQAAIAGSAKIGNQVVLGGNVGVADHTEIVDGCRFAAFSGLHGKYTEKGDYAGNPAMPAGLYRRVVASLPRIPKLLGKISKLEKS